MTHARTNHIAAAILAVALTITVALTTTTAPASARTFYFNSTGSMVQQSLPTGVAPAYDASTQAVAAASAGYGYGDTPGVVAVVTPPVGFDWGDAGIGAAAGFALAMLGLGGALAITRRQRRDRHTTALPS